MEWSAKWIAPAQEMGDVCPVFVKEFAGKEGVAKAELFITAMGVYEASLNEGGWENMCSPPAGLPMKKGSSISAMM